MNVHLCMCNMALILKLHTSTQDVNIDLSSIQTVEQEQKVYVGVRQKHLLHLPSAMRPCIALTFQIFFRTAYEATHPSPLKTLVILPRIRHKL